jgi:hypothetical protein
MFCRLQAAIENSPRVYETGSNLADTISQPAIDTVPGAAGGLATACQWQCQLNLS